MSSPERTFEPRARGCAGCLAGPVGVVCDVSVGVGICSRGRDWTGDKAGRLTRDAEGGGRSKKTPAGYVVLGLGSGRAAGGSAPVADTGLGLTAFLIVWTSFSSCSSLLPTSHSTSDQVPLHGRGPPGKRGRGIYHLLLVIRLWDLSMTHWIPSFEQR